VATLAELANLRTDLDPDSIDHLQRFVGSWSLMADLSFSDLLLLVPLPSPNTPAAFVVVGQIRPNNCPTRLTHDLVGQTLDRGDDAPPLPGHTEHWELRGAPFSPALRIESFPVSFEGRQIATVLRLTGGLQHTVSLYEQLYTGAYGRLARMVTEGAFPFADADVYVEGSPRVGDGVIVVDGTMQLEFASPNAATALHRLGIFSPPEGRYLDELSSDLDVVSRALQVVEPLVSEVGRRSEVAVLIQAIPLVAAGEVTGALVLVRDVTDVRRLDRLVLSKDTAIREVHHRVKNNLQTISSLLSLQARRVTGHEGRSALLEAERRVRSIALVHEVLSREPNDQVPFDDIITSLVAMAQDSVVTDQAVQIVVNGDLGEVDAEIATPLAVALAELLQNAVEHAFARPDAAVEVDGQWVIRHEELRGQVQIDLANDNQGIEVVITDNGRGLPQDFSIQTTTSLGLSIVRDLLQSQLGGTIDMRRNDDQVGGGTIVRFTVPLGQER
jgi:two-component sensor histidine kinase